MNTDLAAFVAARLDEDERIARGALINGRSAEWEVDDGGDVQRVDTQGHGNSYVAVGPWETRPLPGDAAHIVRHDPARVLREVKHKRGLLSGILAAAQRSQQTVVADTMTGMMRSLAAVWSDHPDYDPAWG